MANEFQKALLTSYPNIELLPLDPSNEAEVDAAVASGSTGDTLFEFLWKEMADHSGDPENALEALDHAIRDVRAVREAVMEVRSAPRAPSA
jgi:hypothetical protein